MSEREYELIKRTILIEKRTFLNNSNNVQKFVNNNRVNKVFSHILSRHPRPFMYLSLCLLLLFQSVGMALLPSLANPDKLYNLSDETQQLTGKTNDTLSKRLTYDPEKKIYQYNKEAAPAGNPGSPEEAMASAQQSQKVGGGADNYTVDLSVDPTKGVTVRDATDTSGSLAISMVPQFGAREGKQKDGRIIYPLKGKKGHLVYSVKANGLKEDIVLSEEQGNDLDFSYKLNLPESLEAKLLDNGSIGIYSADTTLFGNISFGSDQDRDRVEKARKNAEKNNLVFNIPAPVVVQANKDNQTNSKDNQQDTNETKKDNTVKSKFELNGDTLTVKTTGLKNANYPLSIDPSVAVTSASDFAKGNLEDGIEIDTTNNQIKRAGLTGGSVGSWTTDGGTSFSGTRTYAGTVAYNGYLYLIGGSGSGGYRTDTQYAPIDPSGEIGAWTTSAYSFTTGRDRFMAVTYNGYIYIMGGFASSTYYRDVQYSKIQSDGSIGAWSSLASFNTPARFGHAGFAYNGYIYITGGCTADNIISCTAWTTNVQYASINADGTLGAWTNNPNSFLSARYGHSATVYNGYMYIMGGNIQGGNANIIQYASINADGSVGTFAVSANNYTTNRQEHTTIALAGYLYVMGGNNGGSFLNTVQYAPINADGSIGVWSTSTNFTTARFGHASIAYNNKLYIIGGCNAGACSSWLGDVQYTSIDPAGVTSTYSTTTSLSSTRFGHASVTYNGYLYVVGGNVGGSFSGNISYAPINSNGTVGAWATAGTFTTARYLLTAVAYNGHMYIMGGTDGTYRNITQYAPINSNGTLGTINSTTTTFAGVRSTFASVAYNGYMYVTGGYNGTTSISSIQYAPIDSNGNITTTWTAGTNMSANINGHAVVAFNNKLYRLGGNNNATVEYLTINSDGSLSASWTATTSFTTGRTQFSATFDKGYMYIFGGGNNSGTYYNDVQYALVNADGTISAGAWKTTQSITTARDLMGAVIHGGTAYITGGRHATTDTACHGSSSQFCSDVQYARVNNGGTGRIGTTTEVSNFSNERGRSATVAYNGYLYVIGGFHTQAPAGVLSDAQYAPILSDGSLGSWQSAGTGGTLASSVQWAKAQARNGYIYLSGGVSNSGVFQGVNYALVCTGENNGVQGCNSTPGTLGTWTSAEAGGSIPVKSSGSAIALVDDYIYVMGGCTSYSGTNCISLSQSVYFARFNSNGTLGAWQSTNAYGNSRHYYSTFASNGYIYLSGGCNIDCSTKYADVQYSKIQSDGSLAVWQTTTRLPEASIYASGSSANGYAYIVGGQNSSVRLASVYFATINSNGTIGDWFKVSTTFAGGTGLDQSDVANYNGYLYATGGIYDTGSTNDVHKIGLNSIDRKGSYSYLVDLAGDGVLTKILAQGLATKGSKIHFGGRNSLVSSTSFGATSFNLGFLPGSLVTIPATESRYRQLKFVLDDTQSSAFPDIMSPQSTLDDFEAYFRAATDGSGSKRLRGGKTFTTEQQRSLDAQPQ